MQEKGQGGLELIVPFQEAKGCPANPALTGCVQTLEPSSAYTTLSPPKSCTQEGIFGINPAQIPSRAAIPLQTAALPS